MRNIYGGFPIISCPLNLVGLLQGKTLKLFVGEILSEVEWF